MSDKETNEYIKMLKHIEEFGIKEGHEFIFTSPYEQHTEHKGKKGKVISIITDPEVVDSECAPLYEIKLEDGTKIQAWPEGIMK